MRPGPHHNLVHVFLEHQGDDALHICRVNHRDSRVHSVPTVDHPAISSFFTDRSDGSTKQVASHCLFRLFSRVTRRPGCTCILSPVSVSDSFQSDTSALKHWVRLGVRTHHPRTVNTDPGAWGLARLGAWPPLLSGSASPPCSPVLDSPSAFVFSGRFVESFSHLHPLWRHYFPSSRLSFVSSGPRIIVHI